MGKKWWVLLLVAVASWAGITGCGSKKTGGNYPPPVTLYKGFNAEHWGKQALDADDARRSEAADALRELKGEGIPFLIVAAEKNTKAGRYNTVVIVQAIDGKLVQTEDFPRLATYLDNPEDFLLVQAALRVIGQGGPRAKGVADKVKPLIDDKQSGKQAREALAAIETK